MASRLEVIRSNKGHHKVIHLGFMYTKHKAMGDKIRWRCVQRGAHCKGSIFTSNDFREPRVTVNHNHMPDFNAVEFARSRTMFAERLAMFHPLEVVELNRDTSRVNTTRLKQESTRVKQEPTDSNGYYCPARDLPSTSSADRYSPGPYISTRTSRKGQAPQLPPPPPKPVQQPPQQQQQQQPQLKRPMMMKPLAPKPRPASPPQPPPPPPEVCLRWNSYHSNMQATFPALLNNEQFVDVTLACEGRSIKCHKMILSACSSYFDELLSQNPCQHPIVLMKDLKFWEVQALVEFMYRGEVNVGQDKLPFLLAAAEALQIKGLASPTSSTPQHDEDSTSLGMDLDYADEYEAPSPSSARRSRKRRTIAAMPVRTPPPPPAPAPAVRSARLQRNLNNNNNNTHHQHRSNMLAQPSTSGYVPTVHEPPTRRRRMEVAEFDVGDHVMREIKLEPVDIDASSDSTDHPAAELFQLTCEPTAPTFHPDPDRPTDREEDKSEENRPDDDQPTPGNDEEEEEEEDEGETKPEPQDEDFKTHEEEKRYEATERTTVATTDDDGVCENGPPHDDGDNAVSDDGTEDVATPTEDVADPVLKPGDSETHEDDSDEPPCSDIPPTTDEN